MTGSPLRRSEHSLDPSWRCFVSALWERKWPTATSADRGDSTATQANALKAAAGAEEAEARWFDSRDSLRRTGGGR